MKQIFKLIFITMYISVLVTIFIIANCITFAWSFKLFPYEWIDHLIRFDYLYKKHSPYMKDESIVLKMLDKNPYHTFVRLWFNVDSYNELKK